MPRQNRVTPFGDIIAVSERGTAMGNRGSLHDEAGRIRRPWQVKRWLICRLEFRGRQRLIMAPNRYTELFFLDEATALAAGHRPCFECRRSSYRNFVNAWALVNSNTPGIRQPTAASIDNVLHGERIDPAGRKQTYQALIDELPDGVFVSLEETGAMLIWKRKLLGWSPAGYVECRPLPRGEKVNVLTPPSSVAVIRAGYPPGVHLSAEGTLARRS